MSPPGLRFLLRQGGGIQATDVPSEATRIVQANAFAAQIRERCLNHSDFTVGPDKNGTYLTVSNGVLRSVARPTTDQPTSLPNVACRDGVILPGRVNSHTHIYSGLVPFDMPAPQPEPENFLQILERVWWRLDRVLDPATLAASARYYVARALLCGTTALIDHHESPDLIEGSLDILGAACADLGIRALLCFGATERNGGTAEAARGLAECERFIKETRNPLLTGAVALHASFTVSDKTVAAAGRLCAELDTIMHIHVAEDGADVTDAIKRGYAGPLERLIALDALPEGSIVAHGVCFGPEQAAMVADSGSWLVQNPRSNQGNKVGYPKYLAGHDHVALGTDGYPADMLEEQRALFEIGPSNGEVAADLDRRLPNGRGLLGQRFDCTLELEEGAQADFIIENEVGVRDVFVGGRQVVADGILVSADLERITAEAKQEAARLWSAMSALPV